ncbi:MAG TPA: type II secretion system protein GspG [Verrucomicrobiae bacterium]|nr:type II secretion system protein GspG [Verrucomicrobiae bacterium]
MRVVLYICGIFAALVAGLFLAGRYLGHKEMEDIKPWVTYGGVMYIAKGCDKYKAQYGEWPGSLAQLVAGRPEFGDPWGKDAWGRYLVLVPFNPSLGYGQIISYGRDGKPGGTGPDRDLVVRFPTDANADWNKQQGVGLKEPRFRL